jgi:pimeloyl-ACP methyl ester carboxylesterase
VTDPRSRSGSHSWGQGPTNASQKTSHEQIDVPVFVGVGERDISGPPRLVPADLPSCNDITVFVLAGAGHNHNVHPDREVLWDRLVTWMRGVVATSREGS